MGIISIDLQSSLLASSREQKEELFEALAKDLYDLSSTQPIPVRNANRDETVFLIPWQRAAPEPLELRDDNPYHQELNRWLANVEAGQTISLEEFIERLNSDPESDLDLMK